MEVLNYFGPPLVKLQADASLVSELNSVADKIIANYETEFIAHKLINGFLTNAENYLRDIGTEYLKTFGNNLKKSGKFEIQIDDTWIVSQKQGVWNPLHHHTSEIGGILYLKMPTVLWEGPTPEKWHPGGICFAEGSSGRFHRSSITLTPKVGEVYLFPAGMLHTIYPFFGPEERRSYVFNLSVLKSR